MPLENYKFYINKGITRFYWRRDRSTFINSCDSASQKCSPLHVKRGKELHVNHPV